MCAGLSYHCNATRSSCRSAINVVQGMAKMWVAFAATRQWPTAMGCSASTAAHNKHWASWCEVGLPYVWQMVMQPKPMGESL